MSDFVDVWHLALGSGGGVRVNKILRPIICIQVGPRPSWAGRLARLARGLREIRARTCEKLFYRTPRILRLPTALL